MTLDDIAREYSRRRADVMEAEIRRTFQRVFGRQPRDIAEGAQWIKRLDMTLCEYSITAPQYPEFWVKFRAPAGN